MCQETSSSNSRQDGISTAIKGFFVGATAIAALYLLEDLISGDSTVSLRGGSNTSSTIDLTLPSNTSNTEDNDINVPSAAPATLIPTYIPTAAGEIPTDMPTQYDNDISSLATLRSNNEAGFRLKLYWETGYYWQEITTEKFWCMACPSGRECTRNSKMELRDCKNKSNQDAQFVATKINKGHQFRVTNTNLCLTKRRRGSAILLKTCNAKNKWQVFTGFMPDGSRFDLKPSSSSKRCLSQHHHPKRGEIIYAESCFKAHRFDTGYWVTY